MPPFVGQDDPPCLPSAHSQGGRDQVGFTQCGGFVRQYLASPLSDALLATFEMKKVPGHTPSIQLGPQRSGERRFDCVAPLHRWRSSDGLCLKPGCRPLAPLTGERPQQGCWLGPPTFGPPFGTHGRSITSTDKWGRRSAPRFDKWPHRTSKARCRPSEIGGSREANMRNWLPIPTTGLRGSPTRCWRRPRSSSLGHERVAPRRRQHDRERRIKCAAAADDGSFDLSPRRSSILRVCHKSAGSRR
jgi:hypothetical protein